MLTSIRFCSSGPAVNPTTPLRPMPASVNLLGAPVKKYPNNKRRQTDHVEDDPAPLPSNSDVFSTPYSFDPGRHFVVDAPEIKQEPDADNLGASVSASFKLTQSKLLEPHGVGREPRPKLASATASRARFSKLEKEALKAKGVIEAYKIRTIRLERKERELLQQLAIKREAIKDTKVEAESAQSALVIAEETISKLEASLEEYKRRSGRYERWWLTENRSLKAVEKALPPDDVEDLEPILSSAQARYAVYCADSV